MGDAVTRRGGGGIPQEGGGSQQGGGTGLMCGGEGMRGGWWVRGSRILQLRLSGVGLWGDRFPQINDKQMQG